MRSDLIIKLQRVQQNRNAAMNREHMQNTLLCLTTTVQGGQKRS